MSFDKLYEMYQADEIDPKFEEIYTRMKTHYERHLNAGHPDQQNVDSPVFTMWNQVTVNMIIAQTMQFIYHSFEDWYAEQDHESMTVDQLWNAFNEEIDLEGEIDFIEENNGHLLQQHHADAKKAVRAMMQTGPEEAVYYKVKVDHAAPLKQFIARSRQSTRGARLDM